MLKKLKEKVVGKEIRDLRFSKVIIEDQNRDVPFGL